MWNNLITQLETSASQRGHRIIVRLNPRIDALPLPIARIDDPFFPFGKAVINATKDVASGYIFDFASYLALGAAGIVALERTIRYIPLDLISILQAPFATQNYLALIEPTSLGVSAVTTTHHLGQGNQFIESSLDVSPEHIPSQAGIYWTKSSLIGIHDHAGQPQYYRVAGESVVFAGKLDDYAQKITERIQEF